MSLFPGAQVSVVPAQAAAEARKQAEKEKREKEEREAQFKALEEKVLSSLPQGLKDKRTPPARAHGEKAAPNPRADISALAARLIEVLFDKQVNCQGVTSWEDVEQRLTSLDAKVCVRSLKANSQMMLCPASKLSEWPNSWSLPCPNAVCERSRSQQRGLRLPWQKTSPQTMVCLVLLLGGFGMPSLCACASFVVLVPAGASAPVSYLSHSFGFSAMSMPSRLSLGTLLEQPKQSNESPESPISFSWRWCHLEGTKLCFGHIFGQFLAGILSKINFFGGGRVSGFLDVFPASYGICDCHLLPLLA